MKWGIEQFSELIFYLSEDCGVSCILVLLRMMSMTWHNLEFGRTGFDFSVCGCSSNAQFHRFSVKNSAKGVYRNVTRGYGTRKLVCCRRDIGWCCAFSTKAPENLLNGSFFI